MKFVLLNFFRWFREFILEWTLLGLIYSLGLVILVEPILNEFLQIKTSFILVWVGVCISLVLPLVLEKGFRNFSFIFKFQDRFIEPFVAGFLYSEFRKISVWMGLSVALILISILKGWNQFSLITWVVIVQLPIQRGLYALANWQNGALLFFPRTGATRLYMAFTVAQGVQFFLLVLASALIFGGIGIQHVLIGIGGFLLGCSVSFEGDSGKPWLVNIISVAAGMIGSIVVSITPWSLLGIAYFWYKMHGAVKDRLHSVEHFYEDTLIS